jgi:hypothetical protein
LFDVNPSRVHPKLAPPTTPTERIAVGAVFRRSRGELGFSLARKGHRREQRCFEAFPMFRG